MIKQRALSRGAEPADFKHDGYNFLRTKIRGILLPYLKPCKCQQAYGTIYDPYPFPFSGPAAPVAADIACFITNSIVVTSVPTLIISNPISPYLWLVSC